jgi:hypothetical protein
MSGIGRSGEMREGQRVKVRLCGAGEEDRWYSGVVVRVKKMWVQLEDYGDQPFIADEQTIVEWKPESDESG